MDLHNEGSGEEDSRGEPVCGSINIEVSTFNINPGIVDVEDTRGEPVCGSINIHRGKHLRR